MENANPVEFVQQTARTSANATVGQHPTAAAVIVGVLVLFVVLLTFSALSQHAHSSKVRAATAAAVVYRKKHPKNKSGFESGSFQKELSALQAKKGGPLMSASDQVRLAKAFDAKGLLGTGLGKCPEGTLNGLVMTADGGFERTCIDPNDVKGQPCRTWDPAASAEAEAVAAAGGMAFSHGEEVLNHNLDLAYGAAY